SCVNPARALRRAPVRALRNLCRICPQGCRFEGERMTNSNVRRKQRSRLCAAAAVTAAAVALPAIAPLPAADASLVIDLTTTTGGKSAIVNNVGDSLTLKVYAVVTGANGTGADDGVQSATGSF